MSKNESTPPCCIVYIWLPGKTSKSSFSGNIFTHITRHIGSIGHAAMQIGPDPDPELYVSWWPEDKANWKSTLPRKKHKHAAYTHEEDLISEKTYHRDPVVRAAANGLRHFADGKVTDEKVVSMYHNQMLHQALGMPFEKMDAMLFKEYGDDQAAFLSAMKEKLSKSVNTANKALTSAIKESSVFDDTIPWVIPVYGLDIEGMIKEWFAIRDKPGAHYMVLRKNCSTIVHRVLAAGGGNKKAGWKASTSIFWTPSRLMNYCRKLNKT